jgi:hypothetical protein
VRRRGSPAAFGPGADIESDEILFREGDVGDALYVVLQGRLQVLRQRPGEDPEVVAEIGRGEPVGEMALITREPRALHGQGASQTPPNATRAIYLKDWLHRQEARYDLVVYLADPAPSSAWIPASR